MRAATVLLLRACLLLGLSAGAAGAQGGRAEREGGTPGQFDFYVLALSWSPGFCETTGDQRGSEQCEAGRGLGFVVHGLWPQYERGFPRSCGGFAPDVPRAVLDKARGLFPDERLARYEWRTHGTCSGLTPSAYFDAVRAARDKITIPDPLVRPTRDGQTSPQTLERAFALVNDGLRPDMMSVQCRRGMLEEVRICLDRDLKDFRRCPEVDRNSCRFGPIRVGAPR